MKLDEFVKEAVNFRKIADEKKRECRKVSYDFDLIFSRADQLAGIAHGMRQAYEELKERSKEIGIGLHDEELAALDECDRELGIHGEREHCIEGIFHTLNSSVEAVEVELKRLLDKIEPGRVNAKH